jgi:hypothetical protein
MSNWNKTCWKILTNCKIKFKHLKLQIYFSLTKSTFWKSNNKWNFKIKRSN